MTDAENIERAPKAFVDPKTTAQKSLVAMSTQNFELYDKCLNEPGFAYHFGQIVNRAFHYEHLKDQNAARANPDPRVAELVEAMQKALDHLEMFNFANDNIRVACADTELREALRKFERAGT